MPKDVATQLLQQSGLSNEILGNIWHSCKTSGFPDLTMDEFVGMMTMASQHVIPYDWNVNYLKKADYQREFQTIGSYQGCVKKADIQAFLKMNHKYFPIQLFDTVYNLVDIHQVDNVTIDQFTILRHIIENFNLGTSLPAQIPVQVLGNISSKPIEKPSPSVVASEYLSRVSTLSVASTESLNKPQDDDLESDIKRLKSELLNRLHFPLELKQIDFEDKIPHLLLVQEFIALYESATSDSKLLREDDKLKKIASLEAAIEKEKLTNL